MNRQKIKLISYINIFLILFLTSCTKNIDYSLLITNDQKVYKIKEDGNLKLYTGQARELFPNGILKFYGSFKDGLKDGEWKYFDIEGNLLAVLQYDKGQTIRDVAYFPNGVVKSEKLLAEKENLFLFKEYTWNGRLKMQGTYLNNLKYGNWITFGEKGDTVGVEFFDSSNVNSNIGITKDPKVWPKVNH